MKTLLKLGEVEIARLLICHKEDQDILSVFENNSFRIIYRESVF
jgi:hypothetical protein